MSKVPIISAPLIWLPINATYDELNFTFTDDFTKEEFRSDCAIALTILFKPR